MKKILIVCEAFGGGVFSYVTQLCNDMCGTFEIYLAYSIRPQTPYNYKELLDQRIQLIEISDFYNSTKPFSLIKTVSKLRSLKEEIVPDLIHLHSSIAGGVGRIAFGGNDCPVVYTPHGYAHVLMGPSLKSRFYYALEKSLGKRNAITLTCCQSEDEEAKKLTKKSTYIETGVNIEELSAALDDVETSRNKRFTVFTLGRACVQKQPHLFNEIAELVPTADFVWIGNGELESELSAENITVTGWKPKHEALAIAKGADAFILCSLGEAIAMSLLENMYIKKLILVSDVMGSKSVISDGVNGYVCTSADEYANKIKEAMKSFPVSLTEQAYEDVVTVFNTETMKSKFIKFYQQCMADAEVE